MNTSKNKLLEWSGVITAIIYSMLVALNIGAEFVGFFLLLTSAILIGLWAYYGKHGGILLLQLFYASAGIIGMVRWFWLKMICEIPLNKWKNLFDREKIKSKTI